LLFEIGGVDAVVCSLVVEWSKDLAGFVVRVELKGEEEERNPQRNK
jgi:hypothetical protein